MVPTESSCYFKNLCDISSIHCSKDFTKLKFKEWQITEWQKGLKQINTVCSPTPPHPQSSNSGAENISVYLLILGLFTGKTGSVMETDENGDDMKDTRTLVIHCEMRTHRSWQTSFWPQIDIIFVKSRSLLNHILALWKLYHNH